MRLADFQASQETRNPSAEEDSASKEQVGIEEDALYPPLYSAYVSGLTHMHILKQT